MGPLRFSIFGQFRVFAPDQRDVTPRSAKAQALLLLLIRNPHGVRGRRWLQDKLWSDRGTEQGSNSLRQELSQIRRVFGNYAEVIRADRQNVWLDLDRVVIDLTTHGEFAEGLDVRDPEFEYWLTCERSRAENEHANDTDQAKIAGTQKKGPSRAAAWRLQVETGLSRNDGDEWVELTFADHVMRLLDEQYGIELVHGQDCNATPAELNLRLLSHRPGGERLSIRAELKEGGSSIWRWSQDRTVRGKEEAFVTHPSVMQLGSEIAEAVRDSLLRRGPDGPEIVKADAIANFGICQLFKIEQADVTKADQCLARAQAIADRGLYWAWRAQVRTIQRVELQMNDLREVREQGAYFAARALELEPNNSMVLALCANAYHILLLDPVRGMELAERAVEINPFNPMAWWALSSARLYAGHTTKSYSDAVLGRYLTSKSPHRFWWDLQLFIAAMMTGRSEEAVEHMTRCSAQNPNFRPPLRYLAALKASMGDEAGAYAAVKKLRSLERDFSIDRMLKDRDYPASLIHRAQIVDIPKIGKVFN